MTLKSGVKAGVPYSLSRWTDLPVAKWNWFKSCLDHQQMVAFDPRTATPGMWSLRPSDTLGLVFWTKDPTNLIQDRYLLDPYRVVVHVTATGWEEVEKGAPSLEDSGRLLVQASQVFEKVYWRFSPIPLLPEEVVIQRFLRLLEYAVTAKVTQVYVSFLQENDKVPETRDPFTRFNQLNLMAALAAHYGVQVLLCDDDKTFQGWEGAKFKMGACVPPSDFDGATHKEDCGCALMVDPFTINETCKFGCSYCLDPGTPVLRSDFSWSPISELQVGDELVGFDEEPTKPRANRKYRKSVVTGVHWLEKPCLLVGLEDGTEFLTSEEHLWLTVRTSNRNSWNQSRFLSLEHRLLKAADPVVFEFDEDYKIGYIAGITLGDGTYQFCSSKQVYWRVALADLEPLQRLQSFLHELDIDVGIKPFDSGSPLSKKPMHKLETRRSDNLEKLEGWVVNEPEDPTASYQRGFLAGFFDAEGSYEKGNLRIHQKVDPQCLLQRTTDYSATLGIPMYVEKSKSARLQGRIRNRIQFLIMTRPALSRKSEAVFGASIDLKSEKIVRLERVGLQKVVDIQTTTKTFIAGGFATHNCYAGDQSISPKKRNTTKRNLNVL